MSYGKRQRMGASPVALLIVAFIHALLGYALLTGLAYTVIHKAEDDLKTFNVQEVEPPPPQKTAPERKLVRARSPRIAASRPVDRTGLGLPSMAQSRWDVPPPPRPLMQPVPARSATADLQKLFRPDDYPPRAIARYEQGTVGVELTVGVEGRVRACNITSSSGSRALDNASCEILQSRATFTPARDNLGNLVPDTVHQEIRWVLQQ